MAKKQTTPETEKVSGLTEEQLIAKETELNAKEVELTSKEELLAAKESELDEKEVELTTKESDLNTKEVELTEREANLSEETEEETIVPGFEFKFRDEDYKFTDTAPKKILFSGVTYTQEELAKDEDAIVQLIGGNSSLIEKI